VSKRWPDKTIVGLTGNIATGKSAVMRLAAERGAFTLDADRLVHEIMDTDKNIQEAIADVFGPEIRKADGRINRAVLGAIVFSNAEALRHLERIVHPAVRNEIARQVDESEARVVFIEAIKLLEGGLARECDQVWVTRCPQYYQIERLIVCRGMDWETASVRINAQSPQEDKVARADVVIDTDGTLADTLSQFELAWERLGVAGVMQPAVAAPVTPRPVARPEVKEREKEVQVVSPPARPATPPPAEESTPRATPQRLSAQSASDLRQRLKAKSEAAQAAPAAEPVETPSRPALGGDITVRRARPSDIPSILLLIQRSSGGAVKIKRAELLEALSERSYFIGQSGSDISTVVGWNVDNLVGRIDQIYIYPLEATETTGRAVLGEVEESADRHICEAILAFPSRSTPDAIYRLFTQLGYSPADKDNLPRTWQMAVDESQPEDTFILLKVLRERPVTQPM
jgi:dephospho-CoA kinase